MKAIVHECIKKWRALNPEKYRAAWRRHAKTRSAWNSIASEFRRILISDLPDFVETRGRKKSQKEVEIKIPKKRGRPPKIVSL